VAPPTLVGPEDGDAYSGVRARAPIKLAWRSAHTLGADEYYEVQVRYTSGGTEIIQPAHVQETYWYVGSALYLQADQETGRVHYWSVRVVQKETDSEGNDVYEPLGPSSEEWTFYWN
jgi:hypothetical protein